MSTRSTPSGISPALAQLENALTGGKASQDESFKLATQIMGTEKNYPSQGFLSQLSDAAGQSLRRLDRLARQVDPTVHNHWFSHELALGSKEDTAEDTAESHYESQIKYTPTKLRGKDTCVAFEWWRSPDSTEIKVKPIFYEWDSEKQLPKWEEGPMTVPETLRGSIEEITGDWELTNPLAFIDENETLEWDGHTNRRASVIRSLYKLTDRTIAAFLAEKKAHQPYVDKYQSAKKANQTLVTKRHLEQAERKALIELEDHASTQHSHLLLDVVTQSWHAARRALDEMEDYTKRGYRHLSHMQGQQALSKKDEAVLDLYDRILRQDQAEALYVHRMNLLRIPRLFGAPDKDKAELEAETKESFGAWLETKKGVQRSRAKAVALKLTEGDKSYDKFIERLYERHDVGPTDVVAPNDFHTVSHLGLITVADEEALSTMKLSIRRIQDGRFGLVNDKGQKVLLGYEPENSTAEAFVFTRKDPGSEPKDAAQVSIISGAHWLKERLNNVMKDGFKLEDDLEAKFDLGWLSASTEDKLPIQPCQTYDEAFDQAINEDANEATFPAKAALLKATLSDCQRHYEAKIKQLTRSNLQDLAGLDDVRSWTQAKTKLERDKDAIFGQLGELASSSSRTLDDVTDAIAAQVWDYANTALGGLQQQETDELDRLLLSISNAAVRESGYLHAVTSIARGSVPSKAWKTARTLSRHCIKEQSKRVPKGETPKNFAAWMKQCCERRQALETNLSLLYSEERHPSDQVTPRKQTSSARTSQTATPDETDQETIGEDDVHEGDEASLLQLRPGGNPLPDHRGQHDSIPKTLSSFSDYKKRSDVLPAWRGQRYVQLVNPPSHVNVWPPLQGGRIRNKESLRQKRAREALASVNTVTTGSLGEATECLPLATYLPQSVGSQLGGASEEVKPFRQSAAHWSNFYRQTFEKELQKDEQGGSLKVESDLDEGPQGVSEGEEDVQSGAGDDEV